MTVTICETRVVFFFVLYLKKIKMSVAFTLGGAVIGGVVGFGASLLTTSKITGIDSYHTHPLQIRDNNNNDNDNTNEKHLDHFTDIGQNIRSLMDMASSSRNPECLTSIFKARQSLIKLGKVLNDYGPNSNEAPSALTVVVCRREWQEGCSNLRAGVNLLFKNPENAKFSPTKTTQIRQDIEKEVVEVLALLHTRSLASRYSV